ncbi:AmmeMemoRadiSam system protein B [Methylotetracoccus oryzae]|uniref:AmmeMemoRadiSam system protein B n=1 Tax=Methylotetracoccus oryzae TaxID=1919059 RepID=UPI00111BCC06|nr:AmmeMemoRadiSam system protein B [Methylotetracoccus oryzae]
MTTTRPPAVAGMFYPSDQHALHAVVTRLLDAGDDAGCIPKAIIAPHAGYIYSGPIAASAYRRLAGARARIRRVVLVGPSHRVAFRGIAIPSSDRFASPLGEVTIDRASLDTLTDLPFVHVQDEVHALEHSLEVQLPFLQETLETFMLIPLVVGDAAPEEIATVLDRLWGGDETLIVISSDLSHYHDYATAQRMDRATSRAIESLRPQDIAFEDACGRLPVSGLLLAASRHGLRAETIDLRNSGDTAGSKDRVVGYGAYALG